MSIKKALTEIINTSQGGRLGEHEILPTKKAELFNAEVLGNLRSQWDAAGRDAAKIYVKLTESDGSDIYLTGWDGVGKFVGQDAEGFGYVESSRIANATQDEKWDSELTLGHIRKNLDEMDRAQVADLVTRLKKCLTKRAKSRRHSEVKNFVKRFQKAVEADKAKEAKEVKSEEKEVKVKGEPKHVLQGPYWVAPRDRELKSSPEDMKDKDEKQNDKKGKYSWHTKGNRSVPMKEALDKFRNISKKR